MLITTEAAGVTKDMESGNFMPLGVCPRVRGGLIGNCGELKLCLQTPLLLGLLPGSRLLEASSEKPAEPVGLLLRSCI